MKRIYNNIINSHFSNNRQIIILTGPRQVGKTTSARMSDDAEYTCYLNWDNSDDRELILGGPGKIAAEFLSVARERKPLLVFDEIHKYGRWRNLVKGFFDSYQNECRIIITGSARLDAFKKSGDSLTGRYFHYRMHPLSVAELIYDSLPEEDIRTEPAQIDDDVFQNLLNMGGFPEPFIKNDIRFYRQWSKSRRQLLLQNDIRDLTKISELNQLEILMQIMGRQAGKQTVYSNLSARVGVSNDTVKRWIEIFEALYFVFLIRPWSKNISRSLVKEPKYFLWDWSMCEDEGSRIENLVASHLLKAVHCWNDSGLGDYGLYYLRDKEKRETDFAVIKNKRPWFLVEVKKSEEGISRNLDYFQKATGAAHAFQVVAGMPYKKINCFEYSRPVAVPLKTFLAQLV